LIWGAVPDSLRSPTNGVFTITILAITYDTNAPLPDLRPYLSNGVFSVAVVTTNELVTISGEVRRPGHYLWRDGLTLTNAIQLAGGLTEFAFRPRLRISHSDGSAERCNYSAIMKGLTNDVPIRAGDQIAIAKRIF
jgi:polysaccharide export outer membrane protein